MKFVLDASVAVAAARPREPSHREARVRIEQYLSGQSSIAVPSLFGIEVASALVRVGEPDGPVRAYVETLLTLNARVVGLGPKRARKIRDLAMASRLRAADATYVWLAHQLNLPLCTLDREMAVRGAAFCTVIAP